MHNVLQLDPRDNVLIALTDLQRGETVEHSGKQYTLVAGVPAKHKFAMEDLPTGASVTMYGVLVGKILRPVRRGELLTTANVHHEAAKYHERGRGNITGTRLTPPAGSRANSWDIAAPTGKLAREISGS